MIDRVSAIHFLNEVRRMCFEQPSCADCIIKKFTAGVNGECPMFFNEDEIRELVYTVEKWGKENPVDMYDDEEDK